MNTYFVYQNWTTEKLYKSGLTDIEADKAYDELDNLIASGCCGDGCATIGNLAEQSDYWVAERLGLLFKKGDLLKHKDGNYAIVTRHTPQGVNTVSGFIPAGWIGNWTKVGSGY